MSTATVEPTVERWVDLLHLEHRYATEFLELVTRQYDALVERSARRILENVQQQQQVSSRLSGAQRMRHRLQQQLAQSLGFPPTAPAADILRHVPPAEAETLSRVVASMRTLLSEVRRRTIQNQVLMTRAMEQLQTVLRAVAPKLAAPNTYGQRGDRNFQGTVAVVSRWQASV